MKEKVRKSTQWTNFGYYRVRLWFGVQEIVELSSKNRSQIPRSYFKKKEQDERDYEAKRSSECYDIYTKEREKTIMLQANTTIKKKTIAG